MDFLKDTVTEMMEGNKVFSDLSYMRKKIETLENKVNSIKQTNHEESFYYTPKEKVGFDYSKFVYVQEYQDSCKGYNKDIFEMNKRIDELKRFLDDINNTQKSKVSDKDLKNLESIYISYIIIIYYLIPLDYLLKKLDESLNITSRKFANKQEVHKNIKFLELQVGFYLHILYILLYY